jgi:hypothetical protein
MRVKAMPAAMIYRAVFQRLRVFGGRGGFQPGGAL